MVILAPTSPKVVIIGSTGPVVVIVGKFDSNVVMIMPIQRAIRIGTTWRERARQSPYDLHSGVAGMLVSTKMVFWCQSRAEGWLNISEKP